ncbi:hypothetical protein VVD49_01460 [Uliginosibacterium sp. H3]|uniref:FecR protein domain-containing protein n=1 Tax=Uliginosibacterium silvisoli TaxID=3114758 RepID=A0ABU6JYX3_9RHOO|nr:hypothetical protein [Uliginosibacterium sp. H3]
MLSRYCLFIALLLPLQVFAQAVGKITFTEGKVRVLRGASTLVGAQGAVVEVTDIVETAKPGFALVEFSDGTVIALGDATRVMLSRQTGKTNNPEVLLLDGWLKVQARDAADYGVTSLMQASTLKTASLIMHGTKTSGEVFVESGAANVGTTDKQGRASGLSAAKAGQFVMRSADKPATSQPRPSEAFLASMPGAFKDALPARLERFKDRSVEAKSTGPVSYEDVADWLTAAPAWRTGFVRRFESRLSDSAFRQQLDAHLKSHPEWDKILHPPKAAN